MADASWNAIDEEEVKLSESYCAFIDILGYKEKSALFFNGHYNLLGRVQRAMRTVKLVTDLASFLTDLSELSVRFFSDSIIVTNPCKPYGLAGILNFTTVLSANLSLEDLFVRGGISRGKHLDTVTPSDTPFLASEALQKAYLLESEHAINPRILVDAELVDFLHEEEKSLVVKEGNDYIAHFGNVVVNRDGNNPEDVFHEMLDIQAVMNRATDSRVKSKYQWVLDYYFWTICTSSGFDCSRYECFASGQNRGFERLQ